MLTKIVDKEGHVSYFDACQITMIPGETPAATIQRSDKPKDQPIIHIAADTYIYLATGWTSVKDDNR
jgi:hypothetical protein